MCLDFVCFASSRITTKWKWLNITQYWTPSCDIWNLQFLITHKCLWSIWTSNLFSLVLLSLGLHKFVFFLRWKHYSSFFQINPFICLIWYDHGDKIFIMSLCLNQTLRMTDFLNIMKIKGTFRNPFDKGVKRSKQNLLYKLTTWV